MGGGFETEEFEENRGRRGGKYRFKNADAEKAESEREAQGQADVDADQVHVFDEDGAAL